MATEPTEERILILAPTGRDAVLASELLARSGFVPSICAGIESLCAAIGAGAGAVLLAEEALAGRAEESLSRTLQRQPAWSDLPVLIFASSLPTQASAERLQRRVEVLGNVTFVERPVRMVTLVTQVKAALRARRRQYAARELMAALHAQQKEAHSRADFEEQLIGIVSHDLRNPLHAILLSTATLLRRESLDQGSLKAVARIQAAADRAVRMIHDLLDFTEARLSGRLRVERAPMDLHETVRQTMAELELAYPDRALETFCEGDGRGEWDTDRIAQVVTNLVSNALRYGDPAAPVRATVREENGGLVLEIHNLGPPIPDELRGRLFEPLQRGKDQARSGGRNIGLGLFIVRQLVDAHGGRIEVDSGAAGTTFRVRLPRRAG